MNSEIDNILGGVDTRSSSSGSGAVQAKGTERLCASVCVSGTSSQSRRGKSRSADYCRRRSRMPPPSSSDDLRATSWRKRDD